MLFVPPNLYFSESDFQFEAVRSQGPGGQHVNKVSSAVRLSFDFENSEILNGTQKKKIRQKLKNRINQDGILSLVCQTHRSQNRNKKEALERLAQLLTEALKKQKRRIPTKIPKSLNEKRLQKKKQQGQKKQNRSNKGSADY